MKLSSISFGNLRRRKGKTLLLVAGLTIGVAMVVAMLGITFQMQADIEKKLDEFGANVIVVPRAENLSLSYGGVGVTEAAYDVEELRESDASLIRTIKLNRNISAVAPKLIGTYAKADRSYLIVGVDFPSEFRIKKWWRLEGMEDHTGVFADSPVTSPGEIILGSSAARIMGVHAGEKVDLGGKDYTVKGVLVENASQDDVAVFMGLREAQGLLGREGAISMIEVSALCSECPIEDIVAQIGAKLPHAKVSAVRQAMALKMETVGQIVRFSIAVSAVVLVIGSLVVFISMLSGVNERTKEIGVLRAIGFRKRHIVKVILTEALVISLAAGLAGWLVGSLSIQVLAPQLMGVKGLLIDPRLLALGLALAVTVGMASSFYPAVKASKLEPIEALRYI